MFTVKFCRVGVGFCRFVELKNLTYNFFELNTLINFLLPRGGNFVTHVKFKLPGWKKRWNILGDFHENYKNKADCLPYNYRGNYRGSIFQTNPINT